MEPNGSRIRLLTNVVYVTGRKMFVNTLLQSLLPAPDYATSEEISPPKGVADPISNLRTITDTGGVK